MVPRADDQEVLVLLVVLLQEALTEPNRVVRGPRPLHVQPEDTVLGLRRLEDWEQLGKRVSPVDQQTELRRFHADRASDPVGLHRVQEP